MNSGNRISSLERATGLTGIAAAKALTPSKIPQNGRSIVIVDDESSYNGTGAVKAFELITASIASVIRTHRVEVENALIDTGSLIKVRKYSPKKFNSTVQNALSEKTPEGEKFRAYMSILVAKLHGRPLMNDEFLSKVKSPTETTFGAIGWQSLWNTMGVLNTEVNDDVDTEVGTLELLPLEPLTIDGTTDLSIIPLAQTPDGGVEKTKPSQDWGGILSGGASVITSIGGVIGLFTGGNQTQPGDSILDGYNTVELTGNEGAAAVDAKRRKNKRTLWVVIITLITLGIIGYVVYRKNKD